MSVERAPTSALRDRVETANSVSPLLHVDQQGNSDLHKYASLGELKKFKTSLKYFKNNNNRNDYLEIVSKYNNERETALAVALEKEKFDIALHLLGRLDKSERNTQFDKIVSISSEKIDHFIEHVKKDKDIPLHKSIIQMLSHKAAELKRTRHGVDFQSKLLMLFAYESHERDIQFRLGTEVKEAAKFDDLVFRYSDNSSSNNKYRFLQAKHSQHSKEGSKIKEDDLLGDTSDDDFKLEKYYNSYMKDKEMFTDGEIEDVILCTNKSFAFVDGKCLHLEQIDIQEKKYEIFSGLGCKLYKLSGDKNVETLKKKFDTNDLTLVAEFLDKLVFAVELPSSLLLSSKIKEKMGSGTYNFIYFAAFKEYIDEWFAERNPDDTARFILHSEIKSFFGKLKAKIASIELNGLFPLSKKKIRKFTERDLCFREGNDIISIKKFLSSNENSDKILKLAYKGKAAFLSIAKVYQVLNEQYTDTKQYTFSDLECLSVLNFDTSSKGIVAEAFQSENKHLFVIECNFIDEDGVNLIGQLCKVLANHSSNNKKIIFLFNEKLNKELDQTPNLPNTSKIDMENNFSSLTTESQDKILKTEIMFYGNKEMLSSLINSVNDLTSKEKNKLPIVEEVLTALINEDNNIIGSKHEYEFNIYIDITRKFNHQVMGEDFLKKCLNERKDDMFAFCSTERNYLNNLVPEEEKDKVELFSERSTDGRFFVLDAKDPESAGFKQISSNNNETKFHWLTNTNNEFSLKHSNGLPVLREFIKIENLEKKIEDFTDSILIIVGDPGVGKSTVLSTYSQKLSLPSWIIRVNLKDHQVCIENANFNDSEGFIEFFSKTSIGGLDSALAKSLLRYRLEHQGQVILLLDGYDEIKDRNQEKVILLIKYFKSTRGKVWLTTRLNQQHKVENALGTFSYFLNTFNEKEQKEFLKQFWIEKLKKATGLDQKEEIIDNFTTKLLEHFHELGLMKKEGLVGIVLQARMVAEIYQDECKEYLKSETFDPSNFKINDISDLYERFIECQYQRYFTEKKKIDNILLLAGSLNVLTESYTKAHGYLALKALFSEDQTCKELLRDQTYEIFSEDELSGMGLIKKIEDNYTADFIHHTYAEYFVAKHLVDILRRRKDHPEHKLVREFLLRNIFFDRNKLISDFLQHEIQKKGDDLNNEWKAIEDCDLLGKIETKGELQLFNPPPVENSDTRVEVQQIDAVSEKSLSDLKIDVESHMVWSGKYKYTGRYFYNGDLNLIDNLFQKFLNETDIETLKTTLKFLIKADGKSHYNLANKIFSRNNNFDNAVKHYLTQAKFQNKTNTKFVEELLSRDTDKELLKNFKCMLDKQIELRNSNEDQKKKCMEGLVSFLFPEDKYKLTKLAHLNNIFYYLLDQNNIEDINSMPSIQKMYQKKIINFLRNMDCGTWSFGKKLKDTDLKYMQSFFIGVTHHPNISGTKSYVNNIYEGSTISVTWLERNGVLISRFLKILTPEMSKVFNMYLNIDSKYVAGIYVSRIFDDFIIYVLDTMETEDLPQINKLAFLKMIVSFTRFTVVTKMNFPFNSNQLKTTLRLIEDMLNEQHILAFAVLESVEYLFVLGTAGLKLINADPKLLVLDPVSGFQCELSSGYNDQIVELIGWKRENLEQPRDEFLKKCFEVVESRKKSVLKRSSSENNLEEPTKRFKSDIQQHIKQQKAFLHLNKFISQHFQNAIVASVKQGLYLHSFEERGVEIGGKCVAITRGLSQASFLQDYKSFLSNLKTSAEIYERIAKGKQVSKREEREVFALSKLLDGFEWKLDSPTSSLPSNLIRTKGYKTLGDLFKCIAGIEGDFAIHLVANNHVVAIYGTGNSYAYFDSNVAFVSGLRSVDQLMEVLSKAMKFVGFKVEEIGFLVEHFDVDKANTLLSREDKKILVNEIKTERQLLAEQDKELGLLKVNGQELSRLLLYGFGTQISIGCSVPLLINAGMNLSSKKFQDHLDKKEVGMTAREYLNHLKGSKNVEEIIQSTKTIPFIGSDREVNDAKQTRKPGFVKFSVK